MHVPYKSRRSPPEIFFAGKKRIEQEENRANGVGMESTGQLFQGCPVCGRGLNYEAKTKKENEESQG
jgi:hypothetical protein